MKDFLLFNKFITPDILIFFYYMGALFIPLVLWVYKEKLLKKFSFFQSAQEMVGSFYSSLSKKDQLLTLLLLVVIFFFLELFWRMMFEMMIGCFDIHNYLFEMSKKMNESR